MENVRTGGQLPLPAARPTNTCSFREAAGNFELPPHEWSYFDPKERQYFTLESEGYSIEVEQGKQYSGAGTTKEDVEELNRDIRFIGRSEPHFSKGSGIRVGSPVFATAVGFLRRRPLHLVVSVLEKPPR